MSNPHNHELNPNNPLVRAAHGHWHAICAIVLAKHGLSNVEITSADIEAVKGQNIVLDERGGKLHIRLVNAEEAARLAKQHGGGFSAS